MTILEILEGARRCLNDHARWTKGTIARYGNQHKAGGWWEPRVQCVCLDGALRTAAFKLGGDPEHPERVVCNAGYKRARMQLHKVIAQKTHNRHDWIENYNDDPKTTHADILDVLDRAIATERAAPSKAQA